jgi:GxxExxY protein
MISDDPLDLFRFAFLLCGSVASVASLLHSPTWKGAVMAELLFERESFAIRGAVFEVYREMGSGFLEAVYQECLEREMALRGIPFEVKKTLKIAYKGALLTKVYTPDFLCYGKVLVEIKAVRRIAPKHKAQILNYLKATNMRLGLLVNFGSHPKATVERYVFGEREPS